MTEIVFYSNLQYCEVVKPIAPIPEESSRYDHPLRKTCDQG